MIRYRYNTGTPVNHSVATLPSTRYITPPPGVDACARASQPRRCRQVQGLARAVFFRSKSRLVHGLTDGRADRERAHPNQAILPESGRQSRADALPVRRRGLGWTGRGARNHGRTQVGRWIWAPNKARIADHVCELISLRRSTHDHVKKRLPESRQCSKASPVSLWQFTMTL